MGCCSCGGTDVEVVAAGLVLIFSSPSSLQQLLGFFGRRGPMTQWCCLTGPLVLQHPPSLPQHRRLGYCGGHPRGSVQVAMWEPLLPGPPPFFVSLGLPLAVPSLMIPGSQCSCPAASTPLSLSMTSDSTVSPCPAPWGFSQLSGVQILLPWCHSC
jgi:hypothetical protein